VRTFEGGADLVISAPIDALYAACELNEWAAGDEPLDAARLRAVVDKERNPELLALRDAAAERGVCFLSDDEYVSVGMGEGSRTWKVDDLPDDVDWNGVHDVPVLLVTGTNGKSTTVRLLASIAEAAGFVPGYCTTDYIRVGAETLDEGDWTGPGAARQVLRHPKTQLAVLEVARGGMLRRGLGVTKADAAAVLNVTDDHIGEFGVDDMETLIETKFLVGRAAKRLVLNADDAGVRAHGLRVHTPITWFGMSDGDACVVDGDLSLYGEAIVPVDEVPVTMGGAAKFNVANALAAIGLAAAIDLPRDAIAKGLRRFANTPDANPGRINVFELDGVTAVVDYAHNPHGMSALLDTASTMPANRRLLALGQGGDRSDEAIASLVRTAWTYRPDRIILKKMRKYLRGREDGEVVGLMRHALLEAGCPEERIGVADSEIEAVEQALAWAREGDLLLFAIQAERPAVIERLQGAG
jgi:UDP-N-acetylmuramyl tripeptide synthase